MTFTDLWRFLPIVDLNWLGDRPLRLSYLRYLLQDECTQKGAEKYCTYALSICHKGRDLSPPMSAFV